LPKNLLPILICSFLFLSPQNIFPQAIPTPPTLISPANEGILSDTEIVFEWNAVEWSDCYNIAIYSDATCWEKVVDARPKKTIEWIAFGGINIEYKFLGQSTISASGVVKF